MTDDYADRASRHGFASKEEIAATAARPDVVILDVRTVGEVADEKLKTKKHQTWVMSSCSPMSCPELENDPTPLLPDKNAPIIIHCKSGRRAAKAKEVLVAKGYKTVLNAGGLTDLDYLEK